MKTFPHYYALNLIFIKAALQMPSKDTLASLYANTAHAKLDTNNDFFFPIGPVYTVASPRIWP